MDIETIVNRSLLVIILLIAILPSSGFSLNNHFSESENRSSFESYFQLPVQFEPNQGQTDSSVNFLSRGLGYSLYIKPVETILQLPSNDNKQNVNLVRMQFVGANQYPEMHGSEQLPGYVNYFIGRDKTDWHTHIPAYASVITSGLYPGIDLRYHGEQQHQLEYDFIVKPGANVSDIQLAFSGVDGLDIDKQGNLILKTAGGILKHRRPIVYQEIEGRRVEIKGRYKLISNSIDDIRLRSQSMVAAVVPTIGFQIGNYDSSKALIIDPIIDYSTYLGGEGNDTGLAVEVDEDGYTYLTGVTSSGTFPVINPAQPALAGNRDMFIVKLNPAGDELVYASYLGGSKDEGNPGNLENEGIAADIVVDSNGQVVVTGTTASKNDFPIVTALQSNFGGGASDAFIAKLNEDGSDLLFSTYLGGSKEEDGYRVVVDDIDNIYATGVTHSQDFPTNNALQSFNAGGRDAYITHISENGSTLINSTYFGGEKDDQPTAITLDMENNIYLGGWTRSSKQFPLVNALQANYGGGDRDGFITKFSAGMDTIRYSTYLGGQQRDMVTDLVINSNNLPIVSGWTHSRNDFPVTPDAIQSSYGGGASDAFITRLSEDGQAIIYSTFLGGNDTDKAWGLALDGADYIYVTGQTLSSNFPLVNPLQSQLGGTGDTHDAFIAQLNPAASEFIYSTYIGGSEDDKGLDIAVDTAGNVVITGQTQSSVDFPNEFALQPAYGGGETDAFIVKLQTTNQAPVIISSPLLVGNINDLYAYDVEAEDPDGDALTYSLIQSPTGMEIDELTGVITWLPDTGGDYPVEIAVSDRRSVTTQRYVLHINTPPQIISSPVTQGFVGENYAYDVNAEDPDGDQLTYVLTSAPAGMNIDPQTGLISWTPENADDYPVEVTVNDGLGGTDSQSYTLTITGSDLEIFTTPATVSYFRERYVYEVGVINPTNQSLLYELTTAPNGMVIDPDTGRLTWEPLVSGTFDVAIQVLNVQGGMVTQEYQLTVLGFRDVLIVSDPVVEAYVGKPYEYQLAVIGPNLSRLTYILPNAPAGMTINSSTGLVQWPTPVSGEYEITAGVYPFRGNVSTQTYTLQVKTLEEMDTMFNEIWNGMFQDLIDGNNEAALNRLNEEARKNYRPVFEVLQPFMEEVFSNYSPLDRVSIGLDTAQYITRRDDNGVVRYFFVSFSQDEEGTWKLDSM